MRTFARQPKAARQTTSAGVTPQLPGNQAIQRLAEASTEDVKRDPAARERAGFDHDFSRVKAHSEPAPGAAGSLRSSVQVHHAAAEGVRGSAQPLPFLAAIQQSFGSHDVTGVRAHLGSQAREANRKLGAVAFTRGEDIAFGRGATLHTAAHEAAHVVQQRAGIRLNDGVGQAGDSFERNADAVAHRVARGMPAADLLGRHRGDPANSSQALHGSGVQMTEDESPTTAAPGSAGAPAPGPDAKTLTLMSWINPAGLPDFSKLTLAALPGTPRVMQSLGMALKCTANKTPPASLPPTSVPTFLTSKEFRGFQQYSLNYVPGKPFAPSQWLPYIQQVGYTAPSKCPDIPPSSYMLGEASPLNNVGYDFGRADPNFESLFKFRVAAAEESAALSKATSFPGSLLFSLQMLP